MTGHVIMATLVALVLVIAFVRRGAERVPPKAPPAGPVPSTPMPDTGGPYDLCEACGKVGREFVIIPGGYSTWKRVPFPVEYCNACHLKPTPHLHRTCPRCKHVVVRPLASEQAAEAKA